MNEGNEETRAFKHKLNQGEVNPREIILYIYEALKERGHNPVANIAGYLASGEPAYITAHRDARKLVQKLDRLDLLEELVRYYVGKK
ncbi:MAG TPA: IreB family regulatory phosphoprotein [Bacillota bacterium]